ncbi:Signal transduction histidine kinase [Mariniphaga anaerophila]|uniref:histidine kinase n=1 Tax=Mariniphaga anaerophila TaxID=1484053 RepID=A0A1M4WUD0_9BACT|nr:histidine kinase [Mariniphaga anaerophila]SHE84653.1 Signal transduction histidine kinase [Mariniphaga anaerophila]
MLKYALLLSMLIQLAATIYAISLIKRTRFNVSWILISSAFVLMAVRRLFDFSSLFWDSKLFPSDEINGWVGVLISVLMLVGVIFIREIFNLQYRIEKIRKDNERRILSAIIKAEDKARQNFARELHDGMGPVLSSIKMSLSAINPESLNSLNQKIIKNAYNATDDSIATLKEISNNLSPHILVNYGLKTAIEDFAEKLFSSSNITPELQLDVDEKLLSDDLKNSSYRIVTELMNNSLKHAEPSAVCLKMMVSGNLFVIQYSDDGSGINNPELLQKGKLKGMGFNNIISRAKSLNGTFSINNQDQGFSIDFYFPLQ